MKKIIGILGVALIVAAMFLNTNAVNGSGSDTSLANLLTLNSANAECVPSHYDPSFNRGRCTMFYGICIPQGETVYGPQACDPYAPQG